MLTKQRYFDTYWTAQDPARVSRRAEWRAMQLYSLVGNHYHHLLDIGAGQGELLHYFRSAGYLVEGWDVSPDIVARLVAGGYHAMNIDIEEDHLEGSFDLIACCEVLQQMHDPARALRKIAGVLQRNGRLFVSVPNEFHIVRRIGFGKPVESHQALFSPRRANELMAIAGFKVVTRLYQPIVPPRWNRVLGLIGQWLADLLPSLFCLSILLLVKRDNDS